MIMRTRKEVSAEDHRSDKNERVVQDDHVENNLRHGPPYSTSGTSTSYTAMATWLFNSFLEILSLTRMQNQSTSPPCINLLLKGICKHGT